MKMDQLENSYWYPLVQKVKQVPEGEIEWIREAGGEELKSAFSALSAT